MRCPWSRDVKQAKPIWFRTGPYRSPDWPVVAFITLRSSYKPNPRNRSVELESAQHVFLLNQLETIVKPAPTTKTSQINGQIFIGSILK